MQPIPKRDELLRKWAAEDKLAEAYFVDTIKTEIHKTITGRGRQCHFNLDKWASLSEDSVKDIFEYCKEFGPKLTINPTNHLASITFNI